MDGTDIYDVIFFEKQEGQLCAQHCLNNLIQQPMFSAIDLADIARQLDESEQGLYTGATGVAPSGDSVNYDDSGFFSVQVITKALELLGLSMVSWSSQHTEAVEARKDPSNAARAYICNHRQHWFTIRQFGPNWFNLNSLLTQPEYISATFLSLFLTQLQQEGYSIFVITGQLPQSFADDYFSSSWFAPDILRALFCNVKPVSNQSGVPGESPSVAINVEDDDLQKALEMSRQVDEDDDQTLKQALELSRRQEEEDELRRALEMSKESGKGVDEESQMQKALEVSRHQAILDMPSTSAGPRLPSAPSSASGGGGGSGSSATEPAVSSSKMPVNSPFQHLPKINGQPSSAKTWAGVRSTNPPSSSSSSAASTPSTTIPPAPPAATSMALTNTGELDAATLRMKRLEFLNKKSDLAKQ